MKGIQTAGDLKKLIKDVPDNALLLFSVDITDENTLEENYDHRYQSNILQELSLQTNRLIFHLFDMDKNFEDQK